MYSMSHTIVRHMYSSLAELLEFKKLKLRKFNFGGLRRPPKSTLLSYYLEALVFNQRIPGIQNHEP